MLSSHFLYDHFICLTSAVVNSVKLWYGDKIHTRFLQKSNVFKWCKKTSVYVAFGGLHFFEGTRQKASKILLSRNGIFVFLPKAPKLAPSKKKKRIEEPKTAIKPKEFYHFQKKQ